MSPVYFLLSFFTTGTHLCGEREKEKTIITREISQAKIIGISYLVVLCVGVYCGSNIYGIAPVDCIYLQVRYHVLASVLRETPFCD